ncbi:gametogenetin-binding protein 2-like [Phlebotomus argentipes]|uniref:gametogenetin-binding protein 2-like n=1 Tax=Phlebotomus argentipes TaxID=94469 RepID=UPI002892D7A5|nr:gametogenetin-binding protein 2-like [Phlebotomus argentipes]
MAKLVYVYRSEEESVKNIGRRQLPLVVGDNLMMLMDLNTKGLVFDHPTVRGRDLEEFLRKYAILTQDEFKRSLQVSCEEFTSVLSQSVPCVGCRRNVERLFMQMRQCEFPTLDPLVITSSGVLTVAEEKVATPVAICTLLHNHSTLLNNLLDNMPRSKKSSRCGLHSLDTFRSRPFSELWQDVWSCMKKRCREEVVIIDSQELQDTLDGYLKKHKFCQDCRTKVEKAYAFLIGENSPPKEKGFVAALYAGIKRCPDEKHIHLQTKADYIDGLIKRAEPELNGNGSRHRERHAKTMEIAQEEVLTCIGMCIYERLRRIHMVLKEEENACQVLAAVSVHCLCRSFDMAVEKKRGKSNLELLYEEISRAERAKEQRREQKKLKKKRKKSEKKGMASCRSCNGGGSEEEEEEEDESHVAVVANDRQEEDESEEDAEEEELMRRDACEQKKKSKKSAKETVGQQREKKTSAVNNNNNSKDRGGGDRGCLMGKAVEDIKDEISVTSCHSCENNACTQSIDGGYVSEPSNHESILSSTAHSGVSSLSSTPEGSEVACSEGFCNHDPSRADDGRCHRGGSPEHNYKNKNGSCGRQSANVCGQLLSLQEMLGNQSEAEEDVGEDVNYIPDEVVQEFKLRHANLKQAREEIRQNLRRNFAQLCMKTSTAK